MGIFIVLGIVVVLAVWLMAIYNGLVGFRNNRENAFADIDVQLKQRHDLIPQLLGAVKGYMEHERGTLEAITNARSRAMNAGTINEKIAAEQDLGAALKQLQTEISDIENKLAAVRRYFNAATKELNIAVQKFPNNIFASMFGFKTEPMFDLGVAGREQMDVAPEIKF